MIHVNEFPFVRITELSKNIYDVPKNWNNLDSLRVKSDKNKTIFYAGDKMVGEMAGKALTLFLEKDAIIKIENNSCYVNDMPCKLQGKILKYDFALDFITMAYFISEQPYLEYKIGRNSGLINYDGKIITDTSKIVIQGFRNGMAEFIKENKSGFINEKFEVTIPPKFTQALNFNSDGLARVSDEIFSGFINKKGEWICKFDKSKMTFFMPFQGKFAVVKNKNEKFGVINKKGKLIVDTIFNSLSSYRQGYAIALKDSSWGLLKKKKWIPRVEYEKIEHGPVKGMFIVKKDDKWGVIDERNQTMLPFIYDKLMGANKSLLFFKQENKWGVMNQNFDVLLKPQYEKMGGYGYGLFSVKKNGKWGYVNTNNEIIIPFIFDSALQFTPYGKSLVRIDFKYELIDSQGRFLSTVGWQKFQKVANKKKNNEIIIGY